VLTVLVIVHLILVALWTKCVENKVDVVQNGVFVHTEIILHYFNGTFSGPSDSPTYIACMLRNLLVLGL